MVKHSLLFVLGLIASILLFSQQSHAFVVQNPRQALSFNNVGRDAVSPADKTKKSPAVQKTDNTPIKYDEIADKLLPEQEPQKFYIDMHKKSAQNISAKPGQSFFIVLPEKEGSSWHFDEKFKLADIVSSEHNKDKRILEFRTSCCGEALLFLDNISEDKSIALQSKIIRLRVHKK